ncbi:R3H domain-containing nucleic acid-binding protein [Myxococcus faecalis]|uniref:R3H domain-containing nucleic acid-binding protein n=1 Tax=Myxococcus faecalis TaxID=3115646 RepID=UPI003CE99531
MTSPRVDAVADDFLLLVEVLPEGLRTAVGALAPPEVLEVVLDLGRVPEARLVDRVVRLRETPVGVEDLRQVMERVGTPGEDNRAGIERTLHRVSAIRNRRGQVVGLTLRVGRAVFGTIDMLKDLIGSGRNLLLLGRPGVGKTTKLREVARVLADDLGKRVMVVDTSNEIGGDGDVPHPGIGGARRMQVSRPDQQHDVMIEAVENHMPEVIIVDEIGTSAEASAARTIAERGVQLVATAHGNTLENLVLNPTLSDLVGGVQTVTLSDDEARRRRTQKTVSERKSPPTFDIVVEMVGRDEVRVHGDTAEAVDRLLAGKDVGGERRRQDAQSGRVEVESSWAGEGRASERGLMEARRAGRAVSRDETPGWQEGGSSVIARRAESVGAQDESARRGDDARAQVEERGMGDAEPVGVRGREESRSPVRQEEGAEVERLTHAEPRMYETGSTPRSRPGASRDLSSESAESRGLPGSAEPFGTWHGDDVAPPGAPSMRSAARAGSVREAPSRDGEQRTPELASAAPPPRQTRFSSRFVDAPQDEGATPAARPTRIYPHGVGRELLQRVLREIPVEVRLVSRLESADLVVTLRSNANDPRMRRVVAKTGARVESVKRSSSAELRRMLKGFFNVLEGVDAEEVREAVAEAEAAVQRALREGVLVELAPRQPRVRKLQHRLVSRYRLEAVSHGSEPSRHLVIYPLGAELDAALAEETEGGA